MTTIETTSSFFVLDEKLAMVKLGRKHAWLVKSMKGEMTFLKLNI
jgi:hypothetical protein